MSGYPHIMQSQLFGPNIAAGQIVTPEERTFKNTTLGWLRVHSIGLGSVYRVGSDYRDQAFITGIATDSRPYWAIRFGSTAITNGFVPMAATTWSTQYDEPGLQTAFNQPVYLAPGDRLDVKVKFSVAPAAAANEYPYLFARCSPVDRPDAIRIPVLSGYETAARAMNSGVDFSEDAPIGTFYNEFTEAIHVERMIGRDTPYENALDRYPTIAQFLVDLALHDGSKITREPTPLASLFEFSRQSWIMNFSLPPQGYIKANVSGNLSGGSADTRRAYLGMLGYRTIG